MMHAKTGRAYAILQSRSPPGEVKRELNGMKEAAGKPEALAIQAYGTGDLDQKGANGTVIPLTIVSTAVKKEANYIVMAEWGGQSNERTAFVLDDVLKARSEVFVPQNACIYYSRNGGPNFQCFASV